MICSVWVIVPHHHCTAARNSPRHVSRSTSDLFLRITSESLTTRSLPERSHIVGDIAGLLLIVLGGAMMVLAALRFRKTTLDIDAGEVRPGPGTRLDIILATLLFLLGAILFVYLSYTVISRF